MEEEKMLEELQHIKKVAPPAHLFSKIENRIKEQQMDNIPLKKLMVASVVLIAIITSNAIFIGKKLKPQQSTTDLTEVFGISSSNQLYHE